jgi:cell shape-determining protein MreD
MINFNQCIEYFTIFISFMIYESMYFITKSKSVSCLLFISFTNSNSILVYYLLFTLHNDEFTWDELLLLRFYH